MHSGMGASNSGQGGSVTSKDEPIDVKTVDWNLAWQTRQASRSFSRRDARFWDKRAASFSKAASETEYADRFLSIMEPERCWTVLDMGCGSGTLAVPLAACVAQVTAVDFSAEMLSLVRARCAAGAIDNVTTLQGQWEDDWAELGIGTYDAAIASRSMVADDLKGSILKLDRAARRRVYVVTIVGDGPYERRLFEAIGRPLHLEPDYIYDYNLLYQMGIFANVTFINEKRRKAYESPEEAARRMEWMFNGLNNEEQKRLNAHLETYLVRGPDGKWRLPYECGIRWAVIWWEKEE